MPRKTLDDYQITSFEYLKSREFACLFDEPGVGKTGPAIMAAFAKVANTSRDPALITCPAYLIPNWEQEIRDFLGPSVKIARADGLGPKARSEALDSDVHFILTSYNNWASSSYPQFHTRKWAVMVFDEAHRMRNPQAKWTKAVFKTRNQTVTNKNTPIWLLTGTPFVRDGGDFFTYFRLFDKKQYGSYWKFVQERCIVQETPWDTKVGNIKKSYSKEFTKELAQFSLRRTVADVPKLASLEFQEHEYYVNLSPTFLKACQRARKEYYLEHPSLPEPKVFEGAGAMYVGLRQAATVPPDKNPKVAWLKDFLAGDPGRVVVYTWFKDSARAMYQGVPKSHKAFIVTGDATATKRMEVVDKWKKTPNGVLVATIPSLKEGISLVESYNIVFAEHSELPSDQEQCIKRLCRRGQTKIVQVHHLWASGTIEMPIRKTLINRNIGITEALAKWEEATDEEVEMWFN